MAQIKYKRCTTRYRKTQAKRILQWLRLTEETMRPEVERLMKANLIPHRHMPHWWQLKLSKPI